MSKVRYTSKELSSMNCACDVLDVMIKDPSFKSFVKKVYGDDKYFRSIGAILGDIEKMRNKMNDGIVEKKPRSPDENRGVYFVRKMDSTSSSRKLRSLTENIGGIVLRYDKDSETCPTDVRVMMYAYISDRGLRDKDGVRVDRNMKLIAPETLGEIDNIPRSDRKTIPKAIKEILQ
jgi:hypothetical protein